MISIYWLFVSIISWDRLGKVFVHCGEFSLALGKLENGRRDLCEKSLARRGLIDESESYYRSWIIKARKTRQCSTCLCED